MPYSVISDAHFGVAHPHRVQIIEQTLQTERESGHRVVWNGDTYDRFLFEKVEEEYQYLVLDQDILLTGNHDYLSEGERVLRVGDTFITHGDLLDFGYAFARLQQLRTDPRRCHPLERLLAFTRRWTPLDVYTLYEVQFHLSDNEAQIFQHPCPRARWEQAWAYLKVFVMLITQPLKPAVELPQLPLPALSGGFMGYFTFDPDELMRRVLIFYPQAAECHTVILGHLHYPIDAQVCCEDGVQRRLICLGAAKDDNATMVRLDDEGAVLGIEGVT